jgi:YidC/Oxa1 family membrane protein insertase
MMSFGVDLAVSARSALGDGFVEGFPHVVMVAIVAVTSWYQQKQIQGRNPNAEMPPQQKMVMRLMPAMFVLFAFVAPSALVVYFIVSNLYRIGMQAYITRTLYHGEDSLGSQAQKAALEAKKLQAESGGTNDMLPRIGKKARAAAIETSAAEANGAKDGNGTKDGAKGSNGSGASAAMPTPTPSAQNRSKKKKKRR